MYKKVITLLICTMLVFTMTSCGESREEKAEQEKAKQEEIKLENETAANAVVSNIETLPDSSEITLKDEPAVEGARSIYDELTDDQKKLVPADKLAKLEEAEQAIADLKFAEEERQRNMKEDKKAAAETEEVIDGIPDKITLDAEAAVEQARASYNQLTDDQKSYVSKDSLKKLTDAETKIEQIYEEEEKKAEEEQRKAEEKARKKAERAKKRAKRKAKRNKNKDKNKEDE